MNLTTEKNGSELTIHLSGNLNTLTAPELSKLLDRELGDAKTLTLDFAECDYVSSAGLRVLLATFKKMKAANGEYWKCKRARGLRNGRRTKGQTGDFAAYGSTFKGIGRRYQTFGG